MTFSDEQIALLETVRAALASLQTSAASVYVIVQQVTMHFPAEGPSKREVRFTWNAEAERFDISS